jgi:hypothetical protein
MFFQKGTKDDGPNTALAHRTRRRELELTLVNQHGQLELRGMRYLLLSGRCLRTLPAMIPSKTDAESVEKTAIFGLDVLDNSTRGCIIYKVARKGGKNLPDGRIFIVASWDILNTGMNSMFVQAVHANFNSFPQNREELQRQHAYLTANFAKQNVTSLEYSAQLQKEAFTLRMYFIETENQRQLRLEMLELVENARAVAKPHPLRPLDEHHEYLSNVKNTLMLLGTPNTSNTGENQGSDTMLSSNALVPSLRRKIIIEVQNQHPALVLKNPQFDVIRGGYRSSSMMSNISPDETVKYEFSTAIYGTGSGWLWFQPVCSTDQQAQKRIFIIIMWDVAHTGIGRFQMTAVQMDHELFPAIMEERQRVFELIWKETMVQGCGHQIWTGEVSGKQRVSVSTRAYSTSAACFQVQVTPPLTDRNMLQPLWLPSTDYM